jgi:hypothetical protein
MDKTKALLATLCTRFDRQESTRRHYNHYALGIYLERVHELPDGLDFETAINQAGFQDRLAVYLRKESR